MSPRPEPVHGGRISYLDGWRGVSILLVLFGHFVWESPFQISSLGVELFFVLSGRLMADILFSQRFPLPDFYWRRISRIYPALVVFVLGAFVACAGSGLAFKPMAIVAALSFTLNYALSLRHGVAAIENLWSLCIEEHAYALLGLLAFLARRVRFNPMWLVLGLAAASMADAVVCTVVLGQPDLKVYFRTDAHVGSILAAVAAFLWLKERPVAPWAPVVFFLAAILAVNAPVAVKYVFVPAFAGLTVCTLGDAPAAMRAVLSWRPLRIAGVWSYSIYLWQQPFNRLALEGRMPSGVALALGVGCGILSFYIVEQPARRWLNARLRSRPSTALSPQPSAGAALSGENAV